jgi:hypothetical protein
MLLVFNVAAAQVTICPVIFFSKVQGPSKLPVPYIGAQRAPNTVERNLSLTYMLFLHAWMVYSNTIVDDNALMTRPLAKPLPLLPCPAPVTP